MSESLDDPNLKSIESAFRALTPATPSLARDRLLYEAGRRSAQRRTWPMLTGLFAATTVVLGWSAATKPEPVREVAYLPAPVTPSRTASDVAMARVPNREPAQVGIVSLLLLGAPDYLPAQPARSRAIEESLDAATLRLPFDEGTIIPSRDRLGLPPGSLGNPPRRTNDFGPIQRGEV